MHINTSLLQLKEECNFETTPVFIRQLQGGDINVVYLIEGDHKLWVVKQNDALKFPRMLEKEYSAMHFLRKKSPLYYPQMLHHFIHENQQFLVMEYVEEGQNSSITQKKLGHGLAQQHQFGHSKFGWEEDNYIGLLRQDNTFKANWNDFFSENRLLFQSKMAFEHNLLTSKEVQQVERLCQRLSELIPNEKPALLHGDLWAGNYFISTQNTPVLYDPAIYFGHREMDIAMTKLFGGFSRNFYTAYQEEFPLEKDWEKRIGVFQLYPNLVHLNLFGGSYLGVIKEVIRPF